jgi:hypothetical protein
MSARAWLLAMTGTAFMIFVLQYILAGSGLAPKGTETLILVILLWTGSWAVGHRRVPRSTPQ